MDTQSLYYFTEAAKDLNFTQTANRLFLSQQNLSSHIARLEAYCGRKLFIRKPKMQLTYEGELFLIYAKQAVASEGNILSALKAVADENSGQLNIGVSTPRAAIFIPDLMQEFARTYPRVSVRLSDSPSYLLEQHLADNSLDFCVGVFHSQNPEVQSIHLLTDKIYLCMADSLLRRCYSDRVDMLLQASKTGISIGEFPDLPVVLPTENIPMSRAIMSCYEEAAMTPSVFLTTTYPQMFRRFYFNGTAAVFVTGMILSDLLAHWPAECSVPHAFPLLLNGGFLERELSLSFNRKRYLSKPAKHFMSLVQTTFAAMEERRLTHPPELDYRPGQTSPPLHSDGVGGG